MNRLFTFVLSGFLIVGVISAQAQAQSPQVGIKGGVNIVDFVNTDLDTDRRATPIIGLVLDFSSINSPVGIETGVFYTRKGAEVAGTDLNVDYLELPVVAKLFFTSYSDIRPHLLVGPYVGYNINTDGVIDDLGVPGAGVDVSDQARDFDFGVHFGIGSDFHIGMSAIDLQVRYGMGLISVFEEEFDDDIRHGVFSILLGLKF